MFSFFTVDSCSLVPIGKISATTIHMLSWKQPVAVSVLASIITGVSRALAKF